MEQGKFSESQIVAILKQQDSGQTVAQISREHGVSEATFYNWKAKYGGMQVSEVKRLKDLEPGRRSGRKSTAQEDAPHRRTGRVKFATRDPQGGTPKKVTVRRSYLCFELILSEKVQFLSKT